MTIEQWHKEQEDEDFGFRLASVSPSKTGLPVVAWMEIGTGNERTIPRVSFSKPNGNNLLPDELIPFSIDAKNPEILLESVTVNLTPKELDAIKKWIMKNYYTLLAHWAGEIDSCEATISLINQSKHM